MSAVATQESIGEKWARQRAILADLRDERQAELSELAERRKELSLDLQLGAASQAQLDSLEAEMRDKTVDLDRLGNSLSAIDKREADELAAARMNDVKQLRKALDAAFGKLAKASGNLADLIEALGAAIATASKLEVEAKTIAGQLDLEVPGAIHEMVTRALAEQGLRLVKLTPFDLAPAATATIPGATQRLRARREPAPARRSATERTP